MALLNIQRGYNMLKKYGILSVLIVIFLWGYALPGKTKEAKQVTRTDKTEEERVDELRRRIDSLDAKQKELLKENKTLRQEIDKNIIEIQRIEDIDLQQTTPILQNEEASQIRITILNGCGIKGSAGKLKAFLLKKGFPVQKTGNAGHFQYKKSAVVYRQAFQKKAVDIAHQIPGWQDVYRMKQENEDVDILIIVGSDLIKKLK
jgi:hypothetical protein